MNLNVKNLKTSFAVFLACAALSTQVFAQVSTPVVGFVTTSLAAGTDSIIAPQILRPSELSSTVSGVSSTSSQAILSLNGASLTPNQFVYNSSTQPKTYFVLVTGGNLTGTYFSISSNDSSSITINLDGLTASSSDITSVEVRPCWTLKTLFPASDANVSFTPSASATQGNRRTQILFPDLIGTGVNRASSSTYFFNNNASVQDWVSTTATSVKAGDTAIFPGGFVIHRNTGGSPVNLSVTLSGAVFVQPLTTYVATSTTTPTDTYVALPRPTDYTLSQLGLSNTSFTQSTSKTQGGRRDTLLVINPSNTGVNPSASATYFRFNNDWYSTAATANPTNNAVIPAGAAVIIRKVVSDGNDKAWSNTLNVSL